MTRAIEPAVEKLIRDALADAPELLPFARAVVLHLSGASATTNSQGETALRVLRTLAHSDDRGPNPLQQVDDLEILASFFQNADLLDPSSPRTARIGHGVMAAVERIQADP